MTNKKIERIIFTPKGNPVTIVSNILKKYNLEESLKKLLERRKRGEDSKRVIIIQKAKDLFLNEISEEDFLSFLKEELQTTEEQAKKIREDIKKDLIRFAKKITVTEKTKESEEKPSFISSLKPSIAIGLEENKKDSNPLEEPSLKDETNTGND